MQQNDDTAKISHSNDVKDIGVPAFIMSEN